METAISKTEQAGRVITSNGEADADGLKVYASEFLNFMSAIRQTRKRLPIEQIVQLFQTYHVNKRTLEVAVLKHQLWKNGFQRKA